MEMRIYLSGPITGKKNFIEVFTAAQDILEEMGYEVVNPSNLCMVMNKSASWEDFMVIDQELIRMCDVLVQLPGWKKSLGCQREYGMALERNMIILEFEDFVKRGEAK